MPSILDNIFVLGAGLLGLSLVSAIISAFTVGYFQILQVEHTRKKRGESALCSWAKSVLRAGVSLLCGSLSLGFGVLSKEMGASTVWVIIITLFLVPTFFTPLFGFFWYRREQ